MKRSSSQGFSIIEIVIATAIISLSITAIVIAMQIYLGISSRNTNHTQAALLIEEAAEGLQIMRDMGWDEYVAPLSLDTPHYLLWSNETYSATTSTTTIQNKYLRTFTLSAVSRDSNDSIVSSGGSSDDNTRLVTLAVRLASDNSLLLETEMLIHNVYDN